MDIKLVKRFMGKIVYYDTGQMYVQGCSIKDFYLSACILRLDKKAIFTIKRSYKIRFVKGQ